MRDSQLTRESASYSASPLRGEISDISYTYVVIHNVYVAI